MTAPPHRLPPGLFRPALLSALFLFLSLATGASASTGFECVMEAARVIELSSRTQGVIEEILVDKGQRVTKGDIIARTDATMETAALRILQARAASDAAIATQKARLDFASAQLARAEKLERQNAQSLVKVEELRYEVAIARSQLRQAESDRASALAEADRARIAVENTRIRAPFGGVVTDVTLSAGEYVTADRHVAVLVQTDPIHVDAFLPADLHDRVRPGDKVRIHPEIPQGAEIVAPILSVDTVLDPASRTFGIRVALPNVDERLVAGQRCTLDLTVQ